MTSIIKFRPFATRSVGNRIPKVMNALCTNEPGLWWHDQRDLPSWGWSNNLWKRSDLHRPVHLIEDDKVWKISCDLPGIKAKDLSITSDGSMIQISASRHYAGRSGDSKTETNTQFFESFPVNSHRVDLSQIKANLSDGVLIVSAPKKSKFDLHKVTVTTDPHVFEERELESESSVTIDHVSDPPKSM
jgi:HSP20 family molecular chaperone IbpA